MLSNSAGIPPLYHSCGRPKTRQSRINPLGGSVHDGMAPGEPKKTRPPAGKETTEGMLTGLIAAQIDALPHQVAELIRVLNATSASSSSSVRRTARTSKCSASPATRTSPRCRSS